MIINARKGLNFAQRPAFSAPCSRASPVLEMRVRPPPMRWWPRWSSQRLGVPGSEGRLGFTCRHIWVQNGKCECIYIIYIGYHRRMHTYLSTLERHKRSLIADPWVPNMSKLTARITSHLHYQYCHICLAVASHYCPPHSCPLLPTCGVTKMRKAGNHWPDFSHAVMASKTGKESNAVNGELSCWCLGHLHPTSWGPLRHHRGVAASGNTRTNIDLTERNAGTCMVGHQLSLLRIPSSESSVEQRKDLKLPHAYIYWGETWLTQRDPHGHCMDLSARCLRLSQQLQGASPASAARLAGWTETWLRVLWQPTIVVPCCGKCGSQHAWPMISNCTLAMQATPSKFRLMAHWPPHKELPTVLKPCRNQQASPIPASPATVGKCWAKDLISGLKPRRFDLISGLYKEQ